MIIASARGVLKKKPDFVYTYIPWQRTYKFWFEPMRAQESFLQGRNERSTGAYLAECPLTGLLMQKFHEDDWEYCFKPVQEAYTNWVAEKHLLGAT